MTARHDRGCFSSVRRPAASVPILLCLVMGGGVATAQRSQVAYVTSEASGAIVGVDQTRRIIGRLALGSDVHDVALRAAH